MFSLRSMRPSHSLWTWEESTMRCRMCPERATLMCLVGIATGVGPYGSVVSTLTPSHLHTLTPSHLHTLTPSHTHSQLPHHRDSGTLLLFLWRRPQGRVSDGVRGQDESPPSQPRALQQGQLPLCPWRGWASPLPRGRPTVRQGSPLEGAGPVL